VPNLNRRDFLKALGVTSGATALSACGLDTNQYLTPIEQILPYVVKPEQVVPGTFTFFATTITRGPHALPVTARHRDGRVTFVSANFGTKMADKERKPPTSPSVPPAALLELQKHYSPDRLRGPSAGGQAVAWDAALSKLAEAVKSAKAAGKKVVYLGGYKSGSILPILNAFTGGNTVLWEASGYAAVAKATESLFGKRELPFYAIDQATYVLSFGAPFLGGWGDADLDARFAAARNPNVGHSIARFALIAPHRDQTGAKADDFLACTPGSEVKVARAIAKIVAERKGASDAIKSLIGAVSAKDAAAASGVAEADITAAAEHFAAGKGLALPGGLTGSTDLAVAAWLINLAGGSVGTTVKLGGYQAPIADFSAIEALQADIASKSVGVLLVDDANPAYSVPGFEAALSSPDLFVVSLSSHASESTKSAKLVLPTSDAFEDWGDEVPWAGLRLLRQPAMSPLYDTRSLGDVLLATARGAGLTDAALSAPTWKDALVSAWKAAFPGESDWQGFWDRSLMDGFVTTPVADSAATLVASSYRFSEAAVTGNGDFYLHIHAHPMRQDGRYANQPWAQEVPDPMTGHVWGSWLEMSPATADKLGVQYGDEIEVVGESGKTTLGVAIYPGLADGTVALAAGQGHTDSGRYATGYGVNAFQLAGLHKDAQGGAAYAPVKVALKPTGAKSDLVTAFSVFGTSDEGRNFGVHVSAEKLAKVGDQAAEHPGELTGIHHLELDERLQAAKVSGFYGLPDHPTYRFGLTVDTNACTGCGACSIACYAENNLPIVGKRKVREGREMGWIRINRYWEKDVGGKDDIHFVPMMCQQCGHAGCENVCPVLATYHNLDGLNAMVYNRCVGTRYCANACPFSARRFNWHTFVWPEPFNLMLNPDVSARQMGVMEKCTFCVQRIRSVKSAFKNDGNFTRTVPSEVWESVPACVEACPSQALVFGNLKDEKSKVSMSRKSGRTYEPLGDLNVFSAVNYLAKANFHDDPSAHHGGGHGGAAGGHGTEHADAAHAAPAAPAAPAGHGAGSAPAPAAGGH
jgi:molybdopterin-containing oxidoreductase family iron-sulfur binding subunit